MNDSKHSDTGERPEMNAQNVANETNETSGTTDSTLARGDEGANVAVVVLDTLRKDAFDRHFDWLPGRRFERAYSTANWTVPAHASLFTGRYSSEVGVHAKNLYFDCEERALAERLRDAGYATRAFSANTNVTGHFEFDRGFTDFRTPDKFDHLNDDDLFDWRYFSRTTPATGARKYLRAVYEVVTGDVSTVQSLKWGVRLKLSDEDGVEYGGATEALDAVRSVEFGEREFLFLNLMEAHEPYRAPDEYATVDEPPMADAVGDLSVSSEPGEDVRQAYDDCARYLSDVYRELFERLDEQFDLVVTLSDHGELLGEHGAWGHEHGVYPELTHVPLCLSGEGFEGTSDAPVSLVDVHATVLDAAGLAPADSDGRGRSLLGDDPGGERLTEYHGLTPWSERKLEEEGYADRVERYDRSLRGLATPGFYGYETPDGFVEEGSPGVKTEAPRERLDELAAELAVRDVAGEGDTEVPEEVEDRLKDLGYA